MDNLNNVFVSLGVTVDEFVDSLTQFFNFINGDGIGQQQESVVLKEKSENIIEIENTNQTVLSFDHVPPSNLE